MLLVGDHTTERGQTNDGGQKYEVGQRRLIVAGPDTEFQISHNQGSTVGRGVKFSKDMFSFAGTLTTLLI